MVINNAESQLCNHLPGEPGGRKGGSNLSREVRGPEVSEGRQEEIEAVGLSRPLPSLQGFMEHSHAFLGEAAQPGLEGGLGQAILGCLGPWNVFSGKNPPPQQFLLSCPNSSIHSMAVFVKSVPIPVSNWGPTGGRGIFWATPCREKPSSVLKLMRS